MRRKDMTEAERARADQRGAAPVPLGLAPLRFGPIRFTDEMFRDMVTTYTLPVEILGVSVSYNYAASVQDAGRFPDRVVE